MGKNVLILSASPRKNGNSDKLCDQFMKGAEEAGHKLHKIYLKDKSIRDCLGCGFCHANKTCVHADDMSDIINAMLQADCIVLTTPVYFYSMNGLLKRCIDRVYSKYKKIKGKDFYFVVTCGAPNKSYTETTILGLRGFIQCLSDAKEKGIAIGVNNDVSPVESLTAYQMGLGI